MWEGSLLIGDSMTQNEFKRKLAAIFSADVKEYSRLMRDDEESTIRTLTAYREVMASLVKQHHGRVVDTVGDNMLAEFASVVDAVQGAVAVQKEIKVRNTQLPENRRMVFRIGINLGDLVVEGDRIYGDGVNIAARLEAMADPGGICISRTAFDQIEDKLPLGYQYLGEKAVKNITKPVRAYKVLFEPEEEKPGPASAARPRHGKRLERKQDKIRKRQDRRERRGAPPDNRPAGERVKVKIRDGSRFYKHAMVYAGVITFLLIINLLSWQGTLWFHWPALAWGLLLYCHWAISIKAIAARDGDKAKIRLKKHLSIYLGVIGFLLIINLLTLPDMLWFHWPALAWGLLLFLHWIKGINVAPKRKP